MIGCKCVVVGDGAVGKTSLLVTFTTKTFPEKYEPTIFDNYSAMMLVDNKPCQLGLWDTAGQEDYARLRPLSYPQTDVFLICFEVSSPQSFHNVMTTWLPEVKHHCPEVPSILVGTKGDLRNDPSMLAKLEARKLRMVQPDEARQLAAKTGMHSYVECSALRNQYINTLFTTAARVAIQHQHDVQARNTKSCQTRFLEKLDSYVYRLQTFMTRFRS